MTALLQIEDLRTHINLRRSVVHALDGVSLRVERGETLGVVGESGCGKTMTALSIMRLLPAGGHIASGRVLLDGKDIAALDESGIRQVRGNEIGMIFQDPMTSLNPTMTIGAQIAETVLLHRGVGHAAATERAIEVLRLVGMPKPEQRINDYPHQFSGGMRQRAMIAMALACEPKLLIADEPTTALDVTIQKQILELIDELRRRLGMAVILITHDLGVIAGRADRVAVMYAGKVVETTSTSRLFANPRHPYTQALFESLPERSVQRGARLYSIPGMPPDLTRPPVGCRFAARCRNRQPRCERAEPPLAAQAAEHAFACFFPVGQPEGAPSATPTPTPTPASAPTPVAVVGADPAGAAGSGRHGAAADTSSGLTTAGGLVQVRALVKDFPVTAGAVLQRRIGSVSAVAGVSFDIPAGQTFGLVGESGCGKTTIGRLVVGLERATSGAVLFDGEDLTKLRGRALRRRRRDVQLMFQDSYASMDPRMRVGSILREPLAIQRVGSRDEQRARIRELLDEVGLPAGALERYPHEFSGGQRQRLGLARALALRPRLIVADEPVSALDVSIQAQILNLMRDLQREHGLTYLFVSHDLSVVRYLASVIGVMYLGKLVEVGPSEQVYARPLHPYTQGLINTIPVADPVRERGKSHHGVAGELPSAVNPPSGCRFRTRCPLAERICAEVEPPLRAFTADGHKAACHFPLRDPDPGFGQDSGTTRPTAPATSG